MDVSESIFFHHDGFEYNDGSKPPLNFDAQARISAYENIDKIIYLERDPRDVICSLYYQVTGRFKDFFKYQGTISDFLRDPYFGAENLQKFRQMWSEIVSSREVLKITYEDMTASPENVLQKVVTFYDLSVTKEKISYAASEASFDNMKSVEQSNNFKNAWLKPRNGFPKVRAGKVGGYQKELCKDDIEFIKHVFDLT